MNAIETYNLTKIYQSKKVIDSINLKVDEGQIFGFLGPNGAGKTTTINLLLGITSPTSGIIKILDKELSANALDIKQEIGYMPQGANLYSEMSGLVFLDFCARFYTKIDLGLRESLVKLFHLPLNKKIRTYSGGMRQQLSLIQAVQHRPRLLILDEPTSGLDPIARDQFYKVIKEMREKNVTVFFSTHILSEIDHICDSVCILKDGVIVEEQRLDLLKAGSDRYIEVTFQETLPLEQFMVPGVIDVIQENKNKVTIVVSKNESEVLSHIKTLPISSFSVKDIGLDQLFLKYFPEQSGQKEKI